MKINRIARWCVLFSLTTGVISTQAQTVTNASVPKAKWQSMASAGLTLTRGNSDTLLATLAATTDRKTVQNEWRLGANLTYGRTKTTVNGVSTTTTTAQSLDGYIQYNQLFTDRFYGYARVEGFHDEVADIKYRVTLSPGAGYYFIKNKTTDLSAEVGPGYEFERLGSADLTFATLRVGERFHHKLSDRARVWETAEWLPQVDRLSNYTINAEVGIEADLTKDKNFTLRCYLDDSYNNEPALGRLKNDAKLVTAIAYKF